jgi:light-regulated signal transduction histidine kinase (bacteriophytochrome)
MTRSELRPVWTDLSALVRSVVAHLAATHPERSVQVTVGDGLQARVDPALGRNLIENLVGNAWKYTSKAPEARIEFGATEQDGSRVFFVRDNGAGFNMDHAGKLFVPFQRLHSAREFPGTGIGLATSHRIVDSHGGRIWAEGDVNRGATFYFSLPGQPTERT